MKISFIGCGNMAQPIITAIAQEKLFAAADINVFDILSDKLNEFCNTYSFNSLSGEIEAAANCDILFLCVKPQGFPALLENIAEAVNSNKPLVVSIAAGKTIASIASFFNDNIRIARIFPSLNASVRLAVSAYTLNDNATQQDKEIIDSICSSFGDAVYLPEDKFSVFGVLSGCAPAYIFMFIDALARAAKANGLDSDLADTVSSQVVYGSAAFLKASTATADNLIDRVCSKGGTTIEGVNSLKKDDLYNDILKAFNASLARDAQLNA